MTNKVTKANWVAESPDGTYFAVAGIEEASDGFSRFALWKIDATTGAIVWKMISGNAGSGSGLESVAFSSDGGIIVGGYSAATGPIGDMVFKSSGIITEAAPTVAKLSAADAGGSATPTSFEWTHTETDTVYKGSTKSMRIDSAGNIFANVGTRTAILKIAQATGTIVWKSGQIDANVQSNDIELIAADGGMILVGHHFGSTTTGCVGTGCSVIKGTMMKVDSTGAKVWGPKFFGNYPGGVNQYAGLGVGNWALIYNECWGVTTTYSPVDNSITGYAMACGTGIENCANEQATSGGGFDATT